MSADDWNAHEITLTAYERGGGTRTLTLPCTRISVSRPSPNSRAELGLKSRGYLTVTVRHTEGLVGHEWRQVAYADGKRRRQVERILGAEEVEPGVLHLPLAS